MNLQELQQAALSNAQGVGIDPDMVRAVWAEAEEFRAMADEVARAIVIGYSHADPIGGMGFTSYLLHQAKSQHLTAITGDWVRTILVAQAKATAESMLGGMLGDPGKQPS